MSLYTDLYEKLYTTENMLLAEKLAIKNKSNNIYVKNYLKKRGVLLRLLQKSLKNKTYKTSEYTTKFVYEPKERLIKKLPFYPDRIVQHMILNILKPIFLHTFITHTYSNIKNRGVMKCYLDITKDIKTHRKETTYCLKIDIHHFYDSIDHDILKKLLRKIIGDVDMLNLLYEIIDSTDKGLPIGNYLSQYLANFYLTYMDHTLKEKVKVKYYYRYCYNHENEKSKSIYVNK